MCTVKSGSFFVSTILFPQGSDLKMGSNSPIRIPLQYPFKKGYQVSVCKAHRPTSETVLALPLLNSYYTAAGGEMQYR